MIDAKPLRGHCKHAQLRNDEDSAVQVSCEGREPAGKGGRYSPATASGLGALRGTSRHIGDDAGEGVPPRPHRDLSPSITPSKEAVGDEESRRAVDCAAPAAARAQSAPALLLVAASNEAPLGTFCCCQQVLARERRRDRLHKRARSEAHAPSPFARMPVRRAHPH